MTVVRSAHEELNAVFEDAGERALPAHYGRPERTHRAVRNGVGVTETAYGVLTVTGSDRREFVDNAVSNRVPDTEGEGCYALLLDPDGRIETDMYVYDAGERLLVFTPPGTAGDLAADWRETVFIQDVDIAVTTGELGVLGVHGPTATEKVAGVLNRTGTPEEPLTFERGRIADEGVTVIRGDDLAGEESYEVVCAAEAADTVFDALLTYGPNAVPFGRRTWATLTLEAGTPLFGTELAGRIPNSVGVRNALDFQKGCYVGQEVVSRIENRGRPPQRLVGLRPESVPESGAAVFDGDASVGEVTRAADAPSLEGGAALALLDADCEAEALSVRVDGTAVPARRVALPFVEGSGHSARLPTYG
jgi:aminomethyltransferase